MFQSLRLGKIFHIETSIHWSFWLLILWVLLSSTAAGGLATGLSASGFVLIVFLCVYLHELGHAFAAKQYGIRTIDITMLPIGGLARLERIPHQASQELWIALAGPAVNVVIAVALGIGLMLRGELAQLRRLDVFRHNFLEQLVLVNLGLAIFNLLPALPMDGGRVLRGLLQFRMSRLRATEIAARVSRYLSLVLILIGLFKGAFTLVLIGGFILMAGFQELMMVRLEAWRESGGTGPWENSFPGGGRVWFDARFGNDRVPPHYDPRHTSSSSGSPQPSILDADDIRRIE